MILIVDDDVLVVDVLKKMLERDGYELMTCNNGNQALRLCRKNPPDLAIVDIFMPEKEGLETIREMKKEYPSLKVIAISGGSKASTQDYLGVASKLGADLTLSKPVEREDLLKAVARLLEIA
jgi:CheY-like chemotaxis protein